MLLIQLSGARDLLQLLLNYALALPHAIHPASVLTGGPLRRSGPPATKRLKWVTEFSLCELGYHMLS